MVIKQNMATPTREQHPGENFQDEEDVHGIEQDDDDEDGDGSSSVGSSDFDSSSVVTSSQYTDTNVSSTNQNKSDSSSSDGIAKEFRAAVLGSKALVLFVLAVAAASVGYATYKSTSNAEEKVFKEQVSN